MSVPSPVLAPAETPQTEPARVRLNYLDGLRGLAALYVVLHHAFLQTFSDATGKLSPQTPRGALWLNFGHFAVAVFIVLSGYCLMLPVARSAEGVLRGGFRDYITRRARRILPPYYAALLLSLLLMALTELGQISGTHWDASLPALHWDTLASHLLVVHNLTPRWIFKINHPMWSVATEWQIYFVFPLLLPLWRRAGNVAIIAVAFALGLAPILLPHDPFQQACPWFLGLFALGMAAAAVGFSRQPSAVFWREHIPWGLLALGLGVGFIAILGVNPALIEDWHAILAMDILAGCAVSALILACTRSLTSGVAAPRHPALRLLDSRGVVALGGFSYSLYLAHAPILALLHLSIRNLPLSERAVFAIMIGPGVLLSLLLSYLFHLAFERRFMSGPAPNAAKTASRPAVETAS